MSNQLSQLLQQQTIFQRTNSKISTLNTVVSPTNHRQYRSLGNVNEVRSPSKMTSTNEQNISKDATCQDSLIVSKNQVSSSRLVSDAKAQLKKRLQEEVPIQRSSRLSEEQFKIRRGLPNMSPNLANRYVNTLNSTFQNSSLTKKMNPQQSLRIITNPNSIEKHPQLSKTVEEETKETFVAYLHYAQRKFKMNIDCTKTTEWMLSQMMKVFKNVILPQIEDQNNKGLQVTKEPNVVSFNTMDNNYPIDVFLQQEGQSLIVFKDSTLNLVPYVPEPTDPKSQYFNVLIARKMSIQDFQFIKCIGIGGFSRVYLVRLKATGKFYAMKLIDKEFIMKNKKQGIVQNERDIMTFLQHPFIIQLEYAFESRNFVVFVVQFCCGGELFMQLKAVKRMTEEQARFYFSEICLGMLFLHSLNIVYRDIKPENILIDMDGHVKIADFGLSKPNMGDDEFAYSFCGSPEYMAPEMLLKTGHNAQVDHYCLGALLYELVTGLPPFYSRNTNEIYESILKEELTFSSKVTLSSEIKDLLNKLLTKSPQNRLGAHGGMVEILHHPWFAQINLVDLIDKKIPPPLRINPLKFTYDSSDLLKGELETREKLLNRTGLTQDIQIFKTFNFNRLTKTNQLESQKAYEEHYSFVCRLRNITYDGKHIKPLTSPKNRRIRTLPNEESKSKRGDQRFMVSNLVVLPKETDIRQLGMSISKTPQIKQMMKKPQI